MRIGWIAVAILLTGEFLFVSSSTFLVSSQSQGISLWGQYHGDETHSGFSSSSGPTSADQFWTYNLGGSVDGLASVSGTLIAVTTSTDVPVAISETTGSETYSFSSGKNCNIRSAYPVISGGAFYSSATGCLGDNALFSDTLSGSSLWISGISGAAQSPYYGSHMIAVADAEVYDALVGSTTLVSLSTSSGSTIWQDQTPGLLDTIPTIGNGVLLVGYSNKDAISAYTATSGSELWNVTLGGPVVASPAYSGGAFYFGSTSSVAYAVSDGGQTLWSQNVGSSIETTPALAQGVAFFGDDDGYLVALNSSTGAQTWSTNLGSQLISPPVVAENGIIYEASTAGVLFALNSNSGKIVWSYDLGSGVTASPALGDDCIFVVDQSGMIHAFGTPQIVTIMSTISTSTTTSLVTANSTITLTTTLNSLTTRTTTNTIYSNMTVATRSTTIPVTATKTISTTTNTIGVTASTFAYTTLFTTITKTTLSSVVSIPPRFSLSSTPSLLVLGAFASILVILSIVWRKRL